MAAQSQLAAGVSIGEGTKRFNDAVNKLHQLMQRWDKFRICEPAFRWQDDFDTSGGGGVADDAGVAGAVVFPQLNHGATAADSLRNQSSVFVMDIEVMNGSQRDVSVSIGLQVSKESDSLWASAVKVPLLDHDVQIFRRFGEWEVQAIMYLTKAGQGQQRTTGQERKARDGLHRLP